MEQLSRVFSCSQRSHHSFFLGPGTAHLASPTSSQANRLAFLGNTKTAVQQKLGHAGGPRGW